MSSTSFSIPRILAHSVTSAFRRFASGPPACSKWPTSPLVIATNFTLWPAAAHMAATPLALSSASSGCAPKAMILKGRWAGWFDWREGWAPATAINTRTVVASLSMKDAPAQIPNPKLQIPTDSQVPNPNKLPIFKSQSVGAWELGVRWDLELGIWDLTVLPLNPRRPALGERPHLLQGGHGGVTGESRDHRPVCPSELHALLGRLAGEQAVEQARGKPVAAADAIVDVELAGRRDVNPPVNRGDRT